MEDYEKKYKEALGRANAKIETYNHLGNASVVKSICEIFPELKESEDERIRKGIIEYLEQSQFGEEHYQIDDDIVRNYIAWLEKQDPKKHEEELERAYKCADEVQYRRGYEDAKREFESQGEQKSQGKSVLEVWKDMRFEVYQQASGNRHEPNYSDDSTKMFSLTNIDEIFEKVAEKQGEQNNKHLYDVIIALWDLLDKIDTFSDLQIDDTNPDNPFKKIEYIAQERHKFVKSDGYNLYIQGEQITDFKQSKQKPVWSEDDEKKNMWLVRLISTAGFRELDTDKMPCSRSELLNWLKSLKGRVQPKQDWSEEDEKTIDEAISLINMLASGYGEKVTEPITFNGVKMINNIKERLRNLHQKPNHWKPSDEQIKALLKLEEMHVLEHEKNQENAHLYMVIKSLKEQLLKLKEE